MIRFKYLEYKDKAYLVMVKGEMIVTTDSSLFAQY